MKELKTLFQAKRILASALALAIAVTMLPVTAYAAPSADNGSKGQEMIADSVSDDNMVIADQTNDSADDQISEDTVNTTLADVGETADDNTSEDEYVNAEDTVTAGDDAVLENNPVGAEDAEASGDDAALENNPVDAEDAEASGDDAVSENDPADIDAEDVDVLTEIENETYVYEIIDNGSSSDKIAEYDGGSQSFINALEKIVIQKDGETIATLADYCELSGSLKTEWVKKGETAVLDSEPIEVGNYQLLVTIPQDVNGGKNAETTAAFDFEITKQMLSVWVSDIVDVTPGIKVSDVSYSANVYSLDYEFDASYHYDATHYDATTSEANRESKLFVEATFKDASTNAELGSDEILMENGSYAVTLHFAFTDKASAEDMQHYEMPEDLVVDLYMTDLATTRIEWKYTDAYIREHNYLEADEDGNVIYECIDPFTYTYTGGEQIPQEGTDYEAHVFISEPADTDGNPIYTKLEGKIEQVWYDDGNNKLEQAPVNAGEYSFALYYAGAEGVYAASYSNYNSNDYGYDRIPVTIEPVLLEITPRLEDDIEFKAGTTVREVLAQADYEVYEHDEKAADGLGERFDDKANKFDRDRFWGTSYDNTTITQSYQPLFDVAVEVEVLAGEIDEINEIEEIGEIEGIDEVEEIGEIEEIEEIDELGEIDELNEIDIDEKEVTEIRYEPLAYDDILEAGKTYHIIFTGYKVIYDANGNISEAHEINNYEYVDFTDSNRLNYTVDEELIYDYPFTVTEATATEIDITAITSIEKAYDGKYLYTDKADYEKAIVKAGESTVASGADDSLTYAWYRQDGTNSVYEVDENGNYTRDENGEVICTDVPDWEYLGTSIRFKDFGTYRLLVTYYDNTHQNASSEAEVLYEITSREVKVVPTGDYEVCTGVTVEEFLNTADIAYEIVTVEEGVTVDELNDQDECDEYEINWGVEKYDTAKDEWDLLTRDYEFEEGDKIRLAVDEFDIYSSNYTDQKVETTETTDETASETKYITINNAEDIEITEEPERFQEADSFQETDNTYVIPKAELFAIPFIQDGITACAYGYCAYVANATAFETSAERDKKVSVYQRYYEEDKDGNYTLRVGEMNSG